MNDNSIEYKFASIEDIKELVNINIDGEEEYRKINQEMFNEIVPQKRVLICSQDKKIIGLMYWRKDFLGRTNQYYIEQITIKKSHRKKGYGLLLLKHFLEICKKQKVIKVFCDIQNNNSSSLQMCLSAGGLISGTIEGLGDTKEKDERVIVRFELN